VGHLAVHRLDLRLQVDQVQRCNHPGTSVTLFKRMLE
jgi:hypothetical protein